MEYKEPTYEEYKKATTYAKIRYRFGVYIQLISFILIILLFVYTYFNVEELKTNPLEYAEDKLEVDCICFSKINPLWEYKIENGDDRNNKST